jgi:hypothetical protein
MITNTSKTGRLRAVYRMANGDQIVGLQHLKDGRSRASGPAKYTFRAADEFAAVAHFNQWKAQWAWFRLEILSEAKWIAQRIL